jgi:hypothetical protein
MQSIQVQVGETARSNDGLSTTKDTRRTVEESVFKRKNE